MMLEMVLLLAAAVVWWVVVVVEANGESANWRKRKTTMN